MKIKDIVYMNIVLLSAGTCAGFTPKLKKCGQNLRKNLEQKINKFNDKADAFADKIKTKLEKAKVEFSDDIESAKDAKRAATNAAAKATVAHLKSIGMASGLVSAEEARKAALESLEAAKDLQKKAEVAHEKALLRHSKNSQAAQEVHDAADKAVDSANIADVLTTAAGLDLIPLKEALDATDEHATIAAEAKSRANSYDDTFNFDFLEQLAENHDEETVEQE